MIKNLVSGNWFSAVKTAPVWARLLTEPCRIKTLEGWMTFEPGQYLCKGPFKDVWGQNKSSFLEKYKALFGEKDDHGWQKYIPIPDRCRVLALQMDRPFTVRLPQGTLFGKEGDYLVKQFVDTLSDQQAWIVDKEIFTQSYQSFLIIEDSWGDVFSE